MKKVLYSTLFSIALGVILFPVDGRFQESLYRQCPQVSALVPNSRVDERHYENLRERLLKICIRENKKEFARMVEKSKEIKALSDSINESFQENSVLTTNDKKQLQKLEKLVDSVRKDLKIKKVKKKDDEKLSTSEALKVLTKAADDLSGEIQKFTRHTVSVVTIKTTNTVLRLARFLRLSN